MTRGIVCIAQNNTDTDYVRLAYLQQLSVKLTNPGLSYALITDRASLKDMRPCIKNAFDKIVTIPVDYAEDQAWKQRNEFQLFDLSPFKQTIKLEADLVLTRSIDNWWDLLQKKDMVLATHCKTYQGTVACSRAYRKVFDLNNLPNIYSGMMYWRKSSLAKEVFELVKTIHSNWDSVCTGLRQCQDPGSNDLVFAIAARLVGEELVTLPSNTFGFAHMKPAINDLTENLMWHEWFTTEINPPSVRIGGFEQMYPVHYQDKNWVSDDIIRKYENGLGSIQSSS
jgi:hypothetical protein